PGLLSAGRGLPVGVVGRRRPGGVRVVAGLGGLLARVVRAGVVGRGLLLGAGPVRVVGVALLLLLPVRVVRLLLRGLLGLLGRDLTVDRLVVLVVADEFVLVAAVPGVVSVVHRCPSRLTRRGTARACRYSARLHRAPGTRRGLPSRLSHG